jgi:ubiquinone/menaquinone biosynthesis C-methylase UbiE/uncharacterized protein YbaR (Trm112 family)
MGSAARSSGPRVWRSLAERHRVTILDHTPQVTCPPQRPALSWRMCYSAAGTVCPGVPTAYGVMPQVQIQEDETLSRLAPLRRILCCPTARTPLSLVSRRELIARLSGAERGKVPAQVDGAFISETAGLAYPIVGRIVSFMEGDVLRLTQTATPTAAPVDAGAASVKDSVREWYDRFGWKKDQQGLYYDTVLASQDTATGHGSYERTSHLSLVDRLGDGEFMLDAASGAIAHPEYLAFSWFYRYRICVDMSLTALQEADRKLGNTGFCCLADITRLPLQTESVDGIVSGYTIQHIPESQQAQAVRELFRVLRPSSSLCVITDVRLGRWHRALVFTLRGIRKILKTLRIVRPIEPVVHPDGASANQPHHLYCVTHEWRWWQRLGQELGARYSVECIRLLLRDEFEWVFGRSTRAAQLLRAVETCFPRLLARASAYCLVDYRKMPRRDIQPT